MKNAIVIESAGMPLAAAVRIRRAHSFGQTHSWGENSFALSASAYEAAGNLRFAATHPATAPARAHRFTIPVRHRQLS